MLYLTRLDEECPLSSTFARTGIRRRVSIQSSAPGGRQKDPPRPLPLIGLVLRPLTTLADRIRHCGVDSSRLFRTSVSVLAVSTSERMSILPG
jgi:hypothetical protein